MHTRKTAASTVNLASFLLKTTEVTARLLLVLSVMIQGSGAPKTSPLPSCPQEAPSSSREGDVFEMAPSLFLHNLPGQDALKGAVLMPLH